MLYSQEFKIVGIVNVPPVMHFDLSKVVKLYGSDLVRFGVICPQTQGILEKENGSVNGWTRLWVLELSCELYAREIRSCLEGNRADLNTPMPVIYKLIERHWQLEKRILLDNGGGNLFFVGSREETAVTSVLYQKENRGWLVDACPLREEPQTDKWAVGTRLFIPEQPNAS